MIHSDLARHVIMKRDTEWQSSLIHMKRTPPRPEATHSRPLVFAGAAVPVLAPAVSGETTAQNNRSAGSLGNRRSPELAALAVTPNVREHFRHDVDGRSPAFVELPRYQRAREIDYAFGRERSSASANTQFPFGHLPGSSSQRSS